MCGKCTTLGGQNVYWDGGGDTAHTLLMWGTIGVGTLHNIERKNLYGRVGDSFRKYCHFVAPSCKLELARFSGQLRIQDGAECGNTDFINVIENVLMKARIFYFGL